MAKPYKYTLDEASLKKAKKELNEVQEETEGRLETFRQWIAAEPWLSAPTDPVFLLTFLRACKFTQLRAREKLAKYMSLFSGDGAYNMVAGTDPGCDENLKLYRQSQLYIIPKGYDKEGRKVIIGRFGKMDTSGKSGSYNDYLKVFLPMFHSMMFFDERAQVNGVVFLMDFADVSMSMLKFMGTENLRRQSEQTNNIPMRMKSINYYNTGAVFDNIMTLFKPFLSQKLQKRIHVHGNRMDSVYKQIEKSMLPAEFLPDDYEGTPATTEEIIEDNIKEYLLDPERRAYLKDFYSGKYFAKLSERDKNEPQGSFRKLNVS